MESLKDIFRIVRPYILKLLPAFLAVVWMVQNSSSLTRFESSIITNVWLAVILTGSLIILMGEDVEASSKKIDEIQTRVATIEANQETAKENKKKKRVLELAQPNFLERENSREPMNKNPTERK
jgi:hypothetical protein